MSRPVTVAVRDVGTSADIGPMVSGLPTSSSAGVGRSASAKAGLTKVTTPRRRAGRRGRPGRRSGCGSAPRSRGVPRRCRRGSPCPLPGGSRRRGVARSPRSRADRRAPRPTRRRADEKTTGTNGEGAGEPQTPPANQMTAKERGCQRERRPIAEGRRAVLCAPVASRRPRRPPLHGRPSLAAR